VQILEDTTIVQSTDSSLETASSLPETASSVDNTQIGVSSEIPNSASEDPLLDIDGDADEDQNDELGNKIAAKDEEDFIPDDEEGEEEDFEEEPEVEEEEDASEDEEDDYSSEEASISKNQKAEEKLDKSAKKRGDRITSDTLMELESVLGFDPRRRSDRKRKTTQRPTKDEEEGDGESASPPLESDFEGDSDSDGGSFKKSKSKRPKITQPRKTDMDAFMWDYPRRSNRAQKVTYKESESENEEDNDEEGEELEKGEEQSQQQSLPIEEEDNVIEKILDHREVQKKDEEGKEFTVNEYLVKWKGRSYMKSVWDEAAHLTGLKGGKRVSNYIKNVQEIIESNENEDKVENGIEILVHWPTIKNC